jgi:hypothetical protein
VRHAGTENGQARSQGCTQRHRRRKPANSCAKICITSGRGSTAQDRPNRRSRLGCPRRDARGSRCRRRREPRHGLARRLNGTSQRGGALVEKCHRRVRVRCGALSNAKDMVQHLHGRSRNTHDRARGSVQEANAPPWRARLHTRRELDVARRPRGKPRAHAGVIAAEAELGSAYSAAPRAGHGAAESGRQLTAAPIRKIPRGDVACYHLLLSI